MVNPAHLQPLRNPGYNSKPSRLLTTALASVLTLRHVTCSKSQHGCSTKVEGLNGLVSRPAGTGEM